MIFLLLLKCPSVVIEVITVFGSVGHNKEKKNAISQVLEWDPIQYEKSQILNLFLSLILIIGINLKVLYERLKSFKFVFSYYKLKISRS